MSESTNCAACRDAFSAHFDGEMQSAELERFNSHLQSCQSCKAEYAAFEKTAQNLDVWFSKTETLKMQEQETGATRAATTALHDPRGNTFWSMALAAAVMLVITAGLFSMVGLTGAPARTNGFHDAQPDLSPLPVPQALADASAKAAAESQAKMRDELHAIVARLSSADENVRKAAEAKLEAYLRANGTAAREVLEQKILPELLVNDAEAEKRVAELLKRLNTPLPAGQ
jgi:hypothetical protein